MTDAFTLCFFELLLPVDFVFDLEDLGVRVPALLRGLGGTGSASDSCKALEARWRSADTERLEGLEMDRPWSKVERATVTSLPFTRLLGDSSPSLSVPLPALWPSLRGSGSFRDHRRRRLLPLLVLAGVGSMASKGERAPSNKPSVAPVAGSCAAVLPSA